MKKIVMAKEMIDVDVNAEEIPPAVKDLQPLFYQEGDVVRVQETDGGVVREGAPQDGIVGIGKTVAEAMEDFQRKYDAAKENSL